MLKIAMHLCPTFHQPVATPTRLQLVSTSPSSPITKLPIT